MNNSFTFYVPNHAILADFLAAVVFFGRPVTGYKVDENGAEVTIMAQAQDIQAYMTYVRAHGLVKPVKMVASQAVMDAPKATDLGTALVHGTPVPAKASAPSIFASVNLDELMKASMKAIQAWVAEHAAQLTPEDVAAMIAWENGQKKPRANLIKGLKVLVGGM